MIFDRRLGLLLAQLGVTERALRTCFGVGAVAHLPRVLDRRADPGPRPPRASLPLWLFCAGRTIDAAAARAVLGDELDRLIAGSILIGDGDGVRALWSLVPIGGSIAVCDRLDDDTADGVPWPDDSSHHLIACLPRARVDRWLDVGSGNAFAPLAAPGAARAIRATDILPRAIGCARWGLALSGITHVETAVADLGSGAGPGWDLVTFNAPIPGSRDPILARFWAQAPALVTPGGEVLTHSRVDDGDPFAHVAHLPGAIVVARYARAPAFAMTSWRPAAPARRALVEISLTEEMPHVTRDCLDQA